MIKNIKELKNKIIELVQKNNIIIISPHVSADVDTIASCIAMKIILDKLQAKSYILMNDSLAKMEHSVKNMLDDLPENIKMIDQMEMIDLIDNKKALLITLDVNKSELVPVPNYSDFNDILVIDHHDIGETTIKTDNLFIDTIASSACEIMYRLTESFGIDQRILPNLVNYLLSGISLDTAKFTNKRTTSTTMKIVSDLLKKGGDLNYVNDLFIDDYEKDMKYLDLVRYATWKMYNISISINNENPNFIYDKEDLAKAADWMLKYKTTDASFALGLIMDEFNEQSVYVSGRSKGIINIGEIMTQFGGGGNLTSGAAKIESQDVKEVKENLEKILRPGYFIK